MVFLWRELKLRVDKTPCSPYGLQESCFANILTKYGLEPNVHSNVHSPLTFSKSYVFHEASTANNSIRYANVRKHVKLNECQLMGSLINIYHIVGCPFMVYFSTIKHCLYRGDKVVAFTVPLKYTQR